MAMRRYRHSALGELADCLGFLALIACLVFALRYADAVEAFIIGLRASL